MLKCAHAFTNIVKKHTFVSFIFFKPLLPETHQATLLRKFLRFTRTKDYFLQVLVCQIIIFETISENPTNCIINFIIKIWNFVMGTISRSEGNHTF